MNIAAGPSKHRLWLANIMAAWSMRRHAVEHWYSIVNTVAIVGVINVAIYFAFFEPPWMTYQRMPLEITTPRVRIGDQVGLRVSRCSTESKGRMYPIAYQMVPEFAGAKPVIMPSTFAPVDPGCTTVDRPLPPVPTKTATGRYHLEGYAQIRGVIRMTTMSWRSQSFEVVP